MPGTVTAPERHEELLRGIASSDETIIGGLLNMQLENIEASGLDPRTHALVRLAALIALDAAPASFVWQVAIGKESGLTNQDVVGVMVALAPTVGMAKIVATAPEIAFALDMPIHEEGGH